jgi:hypothetical protein
MMVKVLNQIKLATSIIVQTFKNQHPNETFVHAGIPTLNLWCHRLVGYQLSYTNFL